LLYTAICHVLVGLIVFVTLPGNASQTWNICDVKIIISWHLACQLSGKLVQHRDVFYALLAGIMQKSYTFMSLCQ